MPEKESIFAPKNPEKKTPFEARQEIPEDFNPKKNHIDRIAEKLQSKTSEELTEDKIRIEKMVREEENKVKAADKDSRIFYSKRRGLKIIRKPASKQWDSIAKRNIIEKGEYIKFEDGIFITTDPGEIAFLEKYSKNRPREVFFQNPRAEKLLKALAMVEEEENKNRGRQGAISGG